MEEIDEEEEEKEEDKQPQRNLPYVRVGEFQLLRNRLELNNELNLFGMWVPWGSDIRLCPNLWVSSTTHDFLQPTLLLVDFPLKWRKKRLERSKAGLEEEEFSLSSG